jgi:hypothetical protein
MWTRSSKIRLVALALFLLFAAVDFALAQETAKPPADPAPKETPSTGTGPSTASPAPAPAPTPRPFRPQENVSPGRKVSFPNDI